MNVTWFVIRGSGLVAFALLALSTIWGLLLSTGMLQRSVSSKRLTLTHEALAVGSLVATFAHVGFLLVDEYVEFTIFDVLVPGMTEWRPAAVSLGIVAMYVSFLVTVSFYVRAKIGQQLWRYLHFASFGVFVAALLHGLLAGTDTGSPAVQAMYVAATTAVLGLLVVRVRLQAAPAQRRVARSAATKAQDPADAAGGASR